MFASIAAWDNAKQTYMLHVRSFCRPAALGPGPWDGLPCSYTGGD
jgi:hypothetical protein